MGFKMQGWSAFTKNGDTKKEAERHTGKTAKTTEFDKADAIVAEPDWSEFSDSKPLTDKEKKAERLKEIELTRKRLANSGKNIEVFSDQDEDPYPEPYDKKRADWVPRVVDNM